MPELKNSAPVAVGDQVSCVIQLPACDQPFPACGLGEVVRVEGPKAAVRLTAAVFE